jgi:DNA repair exonuclease SbcCD ATPase subunit
MLRIHNITMRNFMSIGNVTQAVTLNRNNLTLVLGNNLDLGGDGARNGTGKTTLINALSYGLYGNALTKIKQDNLINKTNGKQMLVTVDFEYNGEQYRIERGRRPAVFRLKRNGIDLNEGQDEAQGENRHTQVEVDQIIGISHSMFKHIVALNTYTEPFLSMRAADQREIIEELLGITELSKKAESLREQIKQTKDFIKDEEYEIKAKEEANKRILKSIEDIERRQRVWKKNIDSDIDTLTTQLNDISHIDITSEIENHTKLAEYNEKKAKVDQANLWIKNLNKDVEKQNAFITKLDVEISALKSHTCYACGQDLHDNKQEEILTAKTEQKQEAMMQILANESQLQEHQELVALIGDIGMKPSVYYKSIQDAYEHQNLVISVTDQIQRKKETSDPYQEQIEEMKSNSLDVISYEKMNSLISFKDHQEFLIKLLTNKDSFIRKKIIDQNLNYLNSRLDYFLEKLGLPHEVKFQSDLSVEIKELGRDLDFDNLSRGERNRLILGLSWAFRDIFESLYSTINVLFVDELIDSGMDTNGVEASLSVLKKMVRESNRTIFLVSHRDELQGRVSNVLNVVKENGFTSFSQEEEVIASEESELFS